MRQFASLAIFCALVACSALREVEGGSQFFTHGASGVQCGEHKCLSNVPCQGEKCVCPHGGIGTFVCPPPDTDYCVIFNDPMARGFDGSHVDLPIFLNKVLMAHVQTQNCKKRRGQHAIGCDVRVYAWGEKGKGKMFIRGLEVKLLAYKGFSIYNHATRIRAEVNAQGKYEFVEEGNLNFLGNPPYGPPLVTNIGGFGKVRTKYNQVDNIAEVDISGCGVVAGIRGVDFTGQVNFRTQVPGVYVTVNKGCEPKFQSLDQSVCAPPPGQGPSLVEQQRELQNFLGRPIPLPIFVMIKIFNGETFNDFPGAALHLQSLFETARECDQYVLVDALQQCLFILHKPLFLNCWDSSRNGNKAIGLMDDCLYSVCTTNTAVCHEVKAKVDDFPRCKSHAPGQGTLLQSDCSY